MNIPRSIVRRRRFIESGSVLALGAVSSALAARKLFNLPASEAVPVPRMAVREAALDPPHPGPPVEEPTAEPSATPPTGRLLESEDEYADFISSLELRHISPHEIIDPHRGMVNGVANSLPPREMWEKLAPTLRVADEIRERLGRPLCRVTSAYRCPDYNAVIPGAVRRSYHTRNQALDLVYFCTTRRAYKVAVRLRKEGFFRGGIGLYPTFIHIDTRGYAATWHRV
ncbi:MAG: DUF882 domain-containing protein [Akkermansiaceae bacterium]|nr:DUF882 domain-containing protein [Akkermansiaceae bacterium]